MDRLRRTGSLTSSRFSRFFNPRNREQDQDLRSFTNSGRTLVPQNPAGAEGGNPTGNQPTNPTGARPKVPAGAKTTPQQPSLPASEDSDESLQTQLSAGHIHLRTTDGTNVFTIPRPTDPAEMNATLTDLVPGLVSVVIDPSKVEGTLMARNLTRLREQNKMEGKVNGEMQVTQMMIDTFKQDLQEWRAWLQSGDPEDLERARRVDGEILTRLQHLEQQRGHLRTMIEDEFLPLLRGEQPEKVDRFRNERDRLNRSIEGMNDQVQNFREDRALALTPRLSRNQTVQLPAVSGGDHHALVHQQSFGTAETHFAPPGTVAAATGPVAAATETTVAAATGTQQGMHFKRIEMPKFKEGQDYDRFLEKFLLASRPCKNGEERWICLENCLDEPLRKDLHRFALNQKGYEDALSYFGNRYGGNHLRIQRLMNSIAKLSDIKTTDQWWRYLVTIQEVISYVQVHNPTELFSSHSPLLWTLRQKLSYETRVTYEKWCQDRERDDTLETLARWVTIETRARTAASDGLPRNREPVKPKKKEPPSRTNYAVNTEEVTVVPPVKKTPRPRACHICKDPNHWAYKCPDFIKMTVKQRLECVRTRELCQNCLCPGHITKLCTSEHRCNHCKQFHHTSLHPKELTHDFKPALTNEAPPPTRSSHSLFTGPGPALQVAPSFTKHTTSGARVDATIFIDPGSQQSFMDTEYTESTGRDLEDYELSPYRLTTMTGTSYETGRLIPDVPLHSVVDKKLVGKVNLVTARGLENIATPSARLLGTFPHLSKLNFPPLPHKKIDILLGADYAALCLGSQHAIAGINDPTAALTPFGWVACGQGLLEDEPAAIAKRANFVCCIDNDQDLESIEKDLMKVLGDQKEQEPDMKVFTANENYVNTLFEEDFRIDEDNHMEVPVAWIPDMKEQIENNFRRALGRSNRLVKDLTRKNLLMSYNEKLESLIQKGYMTIIQDKEPAMGQKYYFGHFPVLSNSKTTPLRIVYDGAEKSPKTGLSWNDAVFAGPNWLPNLLTVLLRFRNGADALVGDISEMFPQVRLPPKDRDMHRILWQREANGPITILQMVGYPFGSKLSPCVAQWCVLKTADLNKEKLPLAAKACWDSRYMDDIVAACEPEDTKRLYEELKELFSLAGMVIRKFITTNPDLDKIIPEADRHPSDSPPILGQTWNHSEDTLSIKEVKDLEIGTKRELLGQIASVFDPLGLVSPWNLQGKTLMQRAWLSGVGWDERLPEDVIKEINYWRRGFAKLTDLKIPRNLKMEGRKQLHIFADASQTGMAAIAYVQTISPDRTATCQFLCSRNRVASLKTQSIPRLELSAAVLASELYLTVVDALPHLKGSVTMWSDSVTVLHWIRQTAVRYGVFVANRIGRVQECTSPNWWRHIEGERNPADIPSRGALVEDLIDNRLYLEGPDFLTNLTLPWPVRQVVEIKEDPELKKGEIKTILCNLVQRADDIPNLEEYEDIDELIVDMALVLRNREGQDGPPTREDREDAERYLIQLAQKEAFGTDIAALRRGDRVPRNSPLIKLTPFLDEDDYLRMRSRLEHARTLANEIKFPKILPTRHPITKLLIKRAHESTHHAYGKNYTLAEVRTKFWILRGRHAVQEVTNNCTHCRRNFGLPQNQQMAPLPPFRIDKAMTAFHHVLVDYTAEFMTMQGRGRARIKRYVCLFACAQTRAIHLEMAADMSADAFIDCLTRFCNRRGRIKHLYSDRGTNFIAGDRVIRELAQQMDQDKIQAYAERCGFTWHFNPPDSPWMGGSWESLIKSAKKALRAVLKDADFTDLEFMSALTGAESIVNSRPLTFQSYDPNDMTVLTPSHFLHGRLDGQVLPEAVDELDFDPRLRWRVVQDCLNRFWTRWIREILPEHGPRSKWFRDGREYVVGDEVLIMDPRLPRYRWNPGRVTEVLLGRDDRVRVVDVRTEQGTLQRPVHRLIPLT